EIQLIREPPTWSPYHMFITWANSTSEKGVDKYIVSLPPGSNGTIGNVERSGDGYGVNLTNLQPGKSHCIDVSAELNTLVSAPSHKCLLTDEITPPLATRKVSAIVGGTIGGVLFFLILVSITVVLLKRNKRNLAKRETTSDMDTGYLEPVPTEEIERNTVYSDIQLQPPQPHVYDSNLDAPLHIDNDYVNIGPKANEQMPQTNGQPMHLDQTDNIQYDYSNDYHVYEKLKRH
ncbi:unnamed protein product, partial [Owenia fusiformis]